MVSDPSSVSDRILYMHLRLAFPAQLLSNKKVVEEQHMGVWRARRGRRNIRTRRRGDDEYEYSYR